MIFLLVDILDVRESNYSREYRTANLSVVVREQEKSIIIMPHDEEKSSHMMFLGFVGEPEKTSTSYLYKVSDNKGLLMMVTIFNPESSKMYLDFEILPENGGMYVKKHDGQGTVDGW